MGTLVGKDRRVCIQDKQACILGQGGHTLVHDEPVCIPAYIPACTPVCTPVCIPGRGSSLADNNVSDQQPRRQSKRR